MVNTKKFTLTKMEANKELLKRSMSVLTLRSKAIYMHIALSSVLLQKKEFSNHLFFFIFFMYEEFILVPPLDVHCKEAFLKEFI